MLNLLPESMTPPPRTPKMIRDDKVKQNKQSELGGAYASFLIGMIACFLAVSIILNF